MTSATNFKQRERKAYLFLTSLVICGLIGALITAPKLVCLGITFPFSTIVFSLMTFPIMDCICELWGKEIARETLYLGLFSQVLLAAIIQLSIMTPHAANWQLQSAYELILASSTRVMIASLLAFSISQILDIVVYQKIKELSQGKQLWLRSNISTYLGQMLDSIIFVNIVFYHSNQKLTILMGAILVKIVLSFLMTPVVYLIVFAVNNYLNSNTLAFKTS